MTQTTIEPQEETSPAAIQKPNAVKIFTKKLKPKVKQELNKRFSAMNHSEGDKFWRTVPIEYKIRVEAYLNKEGVKFTLEDTWERFHSLSPSEQQEERLDQIKWLVSKEAITINLSDLEKSIDDHNYSWQPNLTVKDIKGKSIEDVVALAVSGDQKQIEYLKAIFDLYTRYEKKRTEVMKIDNRIESLREERKNPNSMRDGNFTVEESGLYYDPVGPKIKEGEEKEVKIRIGSPIWPVAHLRNKDGRDHSLLLKVHDGEREHLWAMPKRLITKINDINDILLDLGQEVPIYPREQKHLQAFLMKASPDKKLRCVDKAGWHGEQYIFPDGEVLGNTKDDAESVYPINEACPKGVEEKGTHQQWQDNVLKLCANNSRLIFSVGVSLSAPCLHLLEDEGGVFNFKGVSSIGKTRCLMVATSVFGSPEFKRSWRTTSNGLEGICSLHNDCLLALDEFGQSDAKEVGQIAYMYSQGQGKQRSNRDGSARDTKTWRGMLFSTGEVGISDHMQDDKNKPKAGQLVRVIDIPAQIEGAFGCFEDLHGFENGVDGERFADKLKEVCGEYYGTSGREFIKALIDNGVEKSRKHLKFTRDDFAARVAGKYDGQVKRVANRFGLVYASLSLAIQLGIFSKYITTEMAESAVTRCFNDWLADRGTTDNFESHSIINQVTGLLNENLDSKFIPKNDLDDNRIRTTLWGYKDGAIFYIFPKPFKENLCKGFDEKDAKTMLTKSGLLLPGKSKASQSVRIPAHSKTKKDRFYVIDLNNAQDDEEDVTC